MTHSASFRCLAGCEGAYPLTQAIYRCPKCDGLLDVQHDMKALSSRSPAAWMKLFDDRYKRTLWPYGSGVWGKREWIAPEVPDDAVVSMDEGGTNLFWAERYGKSLGLDDVWVKLCGNSHTGSFKDLGMTVLVSVVRHAIQKGLEVRAIACASTGDTSASLAAYGAAAGLPVVVLLPKGKVSTAQLVQPIASGALVLSLDTDFDGCMEIVQKLAALEKLVKKGLVQKRDRVVVVSTASGLKFTEFKVQYHDKTLPGITSRHANPPQDLPADYDQVLKALDAHAKTLASSR